MVTSFLLVLYQVRKQSSVQAQFKLSALKNKQGNYPGMPPKIRL